ncbi:MAG: ATP-dependent Clp protease ATP-binding subunit [Clostridia bacterium]|nr:ATP-dependent Clp protease ATP-binding subunit [Clostridia bacterium]
MVLFDEIEKAHPDVLNVLLQILDDGRVTDSHGKEVNFENAVIVMTTNAGATGAPTAGFTATGRGSDEARIQTALRAFLRPEFLNRVDGIVVFNRLGEEQIRAVCRIMLGELSGVLAEKGISFRYTDAVVSYLTEKGFSEEYGARNLRRVIQTDLEDEIASVLIAHYDEALTGVAADVKEGAIVISHI